MDGTIEHYAKWISQVVKDKYHYDLTFNWNLINKTNKDAKYNPKILNPFQYQLQIQNFI